MSDPIEEIVEDALKASGMDYVRGDTNEMPLDFYLNGNVAIEVKQFHTPRIERQMAAQENVIVIQGREAAIAFASLVKGPMRYEI
ncbi:MAG: hypothetical protein AAF720_00980 [Pseudomonadota bacterium]